MGRPVLRPVLAALLSAFALTAGVILSATNTGSDNFMSHAHCYLFNRNLMFLHGGSDLLIGIAYVTISATLTYLVYVTRKELPFHWMMLAFALFIIACGATHFMEVWTLLDARPPYWLSGWIKLVTAVASIVTALLLPQLIPQLRTLLRNAQAAADRSEELEKAFNALNELYQRAIASNGPNSPTPSLPQGPEPRGNLETMAKEVSIHARELEEARKAAEQANTAKDQFLAILSHELRNPLTPALISASDLESAENISLDELRQGLGIIRRNIELEARLVDDLLDVHRISRGKLAIQSSQVDLHESIHHAADMCYSTAQKHGNELTLALDASEFYIRGDAARLAQVFWNLMLNAIKFTPVGGSIVVRTFNPEPHRITIQVADSGIGIAPSILPTIFEPFQQGDPVRTRRYGGLGLGLSVAKGLIEAHKGTITAASDGEGKGSTFTIQLNTIPPPVTPKPDGSREPAPEIRPLRIILAEDHADTRAALCRLLARWGHDVKAAGSVSEAVELARTFTPDLLLSDIGLPDASGTELIGQIRQLHPVKAIAMSGYGMEADMKLSRDVGFDIHLVKPIAALNLREALDKLFDHDHSQPS